MMQFCAVWQPSTDSAIDFVIDNGLGQLFTQIVKDDRATRGCWIIFANMHPGVWQALKKQHPNLTIKGPK
jgi:hypothetical protein